MLGRRSLVGTRLLGRQRRIARATGLSLSEAVAGRHEPPKSVEGATRLARVKLLMRQSAAPAPAPAAPAAPAAAAAPPSAPAAAPSGEGEDWSASTTESTVVPGMSDWAAEYLFGDQQVAREAAIPWAGGLGVTPRTPEERKLSRLKRGAPEVARGARILEPGDELPAAEAPSPSPEPSETSVARTPTPQQVSSRQVSRSASAEPTAGHEPASPAAGHETASPAPRAPAPPAASSAPP